jgi:Ca2+-binding RTX toxin-like protein
VSGFEVLNLNADNAASTFTASAAQLAGFTSGITLTTIVATNVTIAVDATTAARATGTVTIDNDATIYTVATAAVAGVAFAATAGGTIAHSITGGDGNDTIDFSLTAAGVNQTLIGGAGNDTIKLSSGTFTADDRIAGGTNTDTLELTGTGALTVTLGATTVIEVENIVISGRTTEALSITTDAATIATGTSLVVTTSQTTGALTFNASAEDNGTVSVTGGGGNDVLTGGAGNDTLIGGSGSDTLVGGAGVDTLTSGSGNNNVRGGLGSDIINLTDGGADLIAFADGDLTTITFDTVTGFGVAADSIRFGLGDLEDAAGAGAITLSNLDGTSIDAVAAATTLIVATNAVVATADATTQTVLKLSSTTATSFASAIGTGSIGITDGDHAAAAEGVLTVFYDATNGQAVVGILTNSTAAGNVLNAADTFFEVARLTMTTTDYATFGATNFTFG